MKTLILFFYNKKLGKPTPKKKCSFLLNIV